MESLIAPYKGLCSIEIRLDGIAFAYTPNPINPEVSICEFEPCQNINQSNKDQIKECLAKIVDKHNLTKTACNWVLHPDYYRLTLLNTPNLPPSEHKNAVRWQIKEVINYPLEDVAVDIFYPEEIGKNPNKIFVITAQHSFLQDIVNIIQECGLLPIAIDIREFAVRNLIADIAKQDEAIGFLSITNDNCLMVFVKQHRIQFVRHIPINLKSIQANHSILITELQRSFNYCQSELKQEIPIRFLISPDTDLSQEITQDIAKNLNKEISKFSLQKTVNFKLPITQQIESSCWVAVGGALRNII